MNPAPAILAFLSLIAVLTLGTPAWSDCPKQDSDPSRTARDLARSTAAAVSGVTGGTGSRASAAPATAVSGATGVTASSGARGWVEGNYETTLVILHNNEEVEQPATVHMVRSNEYPTLGQPVYRVTVVSPGPARPIRFSTVAMATPVDRVDANHQVLTLITGTVEARSLSEAPFSMEIDLAAERRVDGRWYRHHEQSGIRFKDCSMIRVLCREVLPDAAATGGLRRVNR